MNVRPSTFEKLKPLILKFFYIGFALFFIFAGTMHFVGPSLFLKAVPEYLPFPLAIVFISGLAEVGLGALLLTPRFKRLAAWGIIALLIAVFPANIMIFQHQDRFPAPQWIHVLRLPLQAVLIYWAYLYTKPSVSESST
jgi:uncharacterized membrane protein